MTTQPPLSQPLRRIRPATVQHWLCILAALSQLPGLVIVCRLQRCPPFASLAARALHRDSDGGREWTHEGMVRIPNWQGVMVVHGRAGRRAPSRFIAGANVGGSVECFLTDLRGDSGESQLLLVRTSRGGSTACIVVRVPPIRSPRGCSHWVDSRRQRSRGCFGFCSPRGSGRRDYGLKGSFLIGAQL